MPIICLMVRENHKMVREMSGKSQGILWGLMAGHPELPRGMIAWPSSEINIFNLSNHVQNNALCSLRDWSRLRGNYGNNTRMIGCFKIQKLFSCIVAFYSPMIHAKRNSYAKFQQNRCGFGPPVMHSIILACQARNVQYLLYIKKKNIVPSLKHPSRQEQPLQFHAKNPRSHVIIHYYL